MSPDVDEAVRCFMESTEFVDAFVGGPYAAEGYLEPYFYHWLVYEDGIKYTSGDFMTFFEATQRITDIVMKFPSAFDCFIYPEEGSSPVITKPRRNAT
jgi:hypothetical protein